MFKFFFIFIISFLFLFQLDAFLLNNRPCTHRYYNPGWSADDEGLYHGYMDMNSYPYALPVNYCFNPRPCASKNGCSCHCHECKYRITQKRAKK